MNPWPELKWWASGERQVVEEKINDLEAKGVVCVPKRDLLYEALRAVREEDVRVCIVGQDPYPNLAYATGIAFSIPKEIGGSPFPGTLRIILKEYVADTHNPFPDNGDLRRWCSQGVLLWNAIPSVQQGRPLSNDWHEWSYLTSEVLGRLSKRGVVFAFLGAVARNFTESVEAEGNRLIVTGHPSIRGNINAKVPFSGSRIFTTINAKLNELGKEPVDWCLTPASKPVITSPKRVLPNVNKVPLQGLPKPRLPRRWESSFTLEE